MHQIYLKIAANPQSNLSGFSYIDSFYHSFEAIYLAVNLSIISLYVNQLFRQDTKRADIEYSDELSGL